MSATRLLVLGVVRMQGQAHGYRVSRELMLWGAEQWANTKPGSIYHALRQLAKEGKLRTVSVEEGDSAPARTVYEMTEEGKTEFTRLLTDSLRDREQPPDMLSAGVTFLPCLPRAHAITLLRTRLRQAEAARGNLQDMLKEDSWGKPEHVAELFGMWLAHVRASVDWTAGLIERLEAGAYTMADDDTASFGTPVGSPAK